MRILQLMVPLLVLPVLLFAQNHEQQQEVSPFFMQPLGTVIIDAGHGGYDPGAVADHNGKEILEKDITLQLAKKTGRELEKLLPGVTILYTRTDDSFVSLWRRSNIANSAEHREGYSKLFISIHANSTVSPQPNGFELWKLDEETNHNFFSTYLSEDGILRMSKTLNNMLNEELRTASSLASEAIRGQLSRALEASTRDRGIKEGKYYLLHQTIMPAMLFEAGFMSNEEELSRLLTSEYQQLISQALAEGIADYAQQLTASQEDASAEHDTD
ncbi:MAG: N-acetylmuramoyl-L-alanine amidase family protein [Spirochaetota bacterium]